MRILVTGGAGFIGSHLCERLLDTGHTVVALDNLITGSTDNIAHLSGRGDFSFIKHDVTEYIYLQGPVDFIFHLASPASPVDYLAYPIQTLKVGALGTHKALGLAREKGAGILLASTSEVYGDPLVHPQPESYWGNVNPVGPRGVYDEAKRFAEALVFAYHRTHGVDTRVARIFNTYGPRMRAEDGRVVPAFICQALDGRDLTVFGDGTQTRSFCFVSDTVNGLIRLMESGFHEPVNIGNPHEMTIVSFARLIQKAVGKGGGIRFDPLPLDDPKIRRPDISRAREVLGWEPVVSLEEGLIPTIEHFRTAVRK
ncbi:MAG: UDP-glucuronic acid decarboxylase family protein [Candidatus Fermentibacteraceae bacterium]